MREAVAGALALTSVVFHLYLSVSGLIPNLVSRPVPMALAGPWVVVIGARGGRLARRTGGGFARAGRRWQRTRPVPWGGVCDAGGGRRAGAGGWAFAAAGLAGCAWILAARARLDEQYGTLEGPLQMLGAVVLLLVVLEMGRRAIKLALPSVAVIALAYGLLGQHLPGEFGHPAIPPASLLGTLTIAEGGIWGPLTGVSVNVVAVFVMLGAFVGAGEGGHGFMGLATWLAGGLRAGAAKVAVLSSALFGSISGSASANVASTGAITLPAMRRLGYPPALAAAVEAVASSGGQIMPPLMGAGAFVMAELLRTDYPRIMIAATLPAPPLLRAVLVGVGPAARRPLPACNPTGWH